MKIASVTVPSICALLRLAFVKFAFVKSGDEKESDIKYVPTAVAPIQLEFLREP